MAFPDALQRIKEYVESLTGLPAESAVDLGPRVRRAAILLRRSGMRCTRAGEIHTIELIMHRQAQSAAASQPNVDLLLDWAQDICDWLRSNPLDGVLVVYWPEGIEVSVQTEDEGESVIMTIPVAEVYP